MQGNNLNNFCEQIADEVLKVGRIGLLVEHPKVILPDQTIEVTRAQAEANNFRPFIVKYKTEDIINWSTRVVNNVKVLSLVVLRETVETFNSDFEPSTETKYRVLKLDDANNYLQQVWKQVDTKDNKEVSFVQEGTDIYPIKNGAKFNYIPFIFIGPDGSEVDVSKSPILDLVNVNLSHYKTTADIEHAAHYTALPVPVVTGHTLQENQKLRIGSSEAWVFSEPEAKAFYLEYSGKGLESLEKRIEKKEQQMAALGARMLANDKMAAETAESHSIKRQGENSALSSIASAISDGITTALKIIVEWNGADSKDVSLEINKDFMPSPLDPQALVALIQCWQAGGMAFPDFVKQLQKGEIIDADRTPEDIKLDIEAEGPAVNPLINDPNPGE
jgi:hypothetical protein